MAAAKNGLKHVVIYTDGACDGNPGHGGYGVVLMYGGRRKELSGGFQRTTNNRMEVLAAIIGLKALKECCRVMLYSDSRYLVDAMEKGWVRRWQENDWRREKGRRAANVDLWERLVALCDQHEVEFVWVKGHSGDPENERCDTLSYRALEGDDLAVDEGFEWELAHGRPARGKITQEGQLCRNCSTPVVKKVPKRKLKPGQKHYYDYYLYCEGCETMYMVEEAKRLLQDNTLL
jgi:ribonuclease HI